MATYQEIIGRLFDLQKFGMKFGLESMKSILNRLGNPEKDQRYIHLAGTNGKGSTAAMLAEILKRSGYKTGLYTSPHLVTFRERIQINGRLISENDVADLSAEVWEAINPKSPPTFFEFVTAMAFLYFKRQAVDMAVIETGLGGRLDSTNVIIPLVSAITNIGLEHTEQLGPTISDIAYEKAGIIKPGALFVGGRLCKDALAVIEKKLKDNNVSQALFLDRDYRAIETTKSETKKSETHKNDAHQNQSANSPGASSLTLKHLTINYQSSRWAFDNIILNLSATYQIDNAAMAIAIAESIDSLGVKIINQAVYEGLANTSWPGRAESFAPHSWPMDKSAKAPLLLDGAHNPAGAAALAEFLSVTSKKRLHLILGVMADKDIGGVLGPILPLADRLYLTRPTYSRAATPQMLLDKLTSCFGSPSCPTELYPTLPEAVAAAASLAEPEDLVLISGSLFTVGEARAHLMGIDSVETN
ncbi:MAG: bifunctional folylpolyglutamate synthase/dihydrofolate synthase [Deltaproteobacteria bacterium]|jgi:dihydrofolate synthase/folylpolyglutamate synthase|nr:bifunctional folylpolyglutamate synthase/dihydrofolate synthase [Deltaproteobacteria bacterium]